MIRRAVATTFFALAATTVSAAPVYHASDNGAMVTVSGDSISVSLHSEGNILAGSGRITKDFSELLLYPIDSRFTRKAEQSGTGENDADDDDESEEESQNAASSKHAVWKASFIFVDGKAQGVIEQTGGASRIFDAHLTTQARQKAEQSGTGE